MMSKQKEEKGQGTEKIVTITTSPTLIFNENPHRKEWIFQSYQSNTVTVYISKNKDVNTSGTQKGRELRAGELESVNAKDDPILVKQPQYGIVASGSADIWVWEG